MVKQIKNDNVISLCNNRFKFIVQKHKYKKNIGGGTRLVEVALILLKDCVTGRDIVHPFTGFIQSNYSNTSIKTQVDYAQKITPFLNFIMDNRLRVKINSFAELRYEHASDFLNKHCESLARDTYIEYMKKISMFYYYLTCKDVLKYCSKSDFIWKELMGRDGKPTKVLVAPFPDLEIPERKPKSKNEHYMEYELQALLLEIAYEEVNRIALGIAMQIFGGLRVSEVVRSKYSLMTTLGYYGEHGLMIKLDDTDEGNRPDLLNNGAKGYVKRPRLQNIYSPFGITGALLKQHREKYKSINHSDAVFINADGMPMSYESYLYYFGKLKKRFIEVLKNSSVPQVKVQSIIYNSKRWNTHIGRGIFSNNLVDFVDNPVRIMLERGDLSKEAVEVYLANSRKLGKRFEEVTEGTYNNIISKINR